MSKLKFYDNGSITTENSVSAGNNISLILGPNNVRGTLQDTFDGASLGYLLTVQNDTYYFAYDIFSSSSALQVSPPQGNDVILRAYAHGSNGGYQMDRSQVYEISLFLSTGPGTMINEIPVFPFKLISGPAIDSADYSFDWITIDSALHADGSIICGRDNAADSSNLVVGWDNMVQGNDNIVIGQHAKVSGTNNIISMYLSAVPKGNYVSISGSSNIMAGNFGGSIWKGSYSLAVGAMLNNYGIYNTLLGYQNFIGSSYADSRQSFATGSANFVYGNNSFAIGGGYGTTSTVIPVLSTNTKLLGEFSGSIGSCNLIGFRGVPLKAINAVKAASTFTVTLRRKTDTLTSGILYAFAFSQSSFIYGKVASSTVDANGYKVYTITATDFSGVATPVPRAVNVDFSANNERFYWNMAVPADGSFITNGSGLTPGFSATSKSNYALSPVNSYKVDEQTSGLGSIAIGNNNVILGSRNVFMGNDLFMNNYYDKLVMIGNGNGIPVSMGSYAPFSSSHQDGDAFGGSTHSRMVKIINRYATNNGTTTSEYNSDITMAATGVTYTARSHTFSCNTVNSTAHKIALNAPLTLSSSYTYGSSLPTTYLQSGRIFFLV